MGISYKWNYNMWPSVSGFFIMCINYLLLHNKLLYLKNSLFYKFGSILAEQFWLRVSPVAADKMSAGLSVT